MSDYLTDISAMTHVSGMSGRTALILIEHLLWLSKPFSHRASCYQDVDMGKAYSNGQKYRSRRAAALQEICHIHIWGVFHVLSISVEGR